MIVLPEEISISTVAALQSALLAARVLELPTILVLRNVEEIDTAGLQLLMRLRQAAREKGVRLRLKDHSFAALRLLDLSGTAAFFGDRLVIPAGRRSLLPFRYGTKRKESQA